MAAGKKAAPGSIFRVNVTYLAPVLITVFFLCLSLLNPPFIDEYLEALTVDYRFKLGRVIHPVSPPEDIVVVAIDEKSLSRYGRWPWSRTVIAELLERIFDGEPKVVAADIFFPESESEAADKRLAETLKRYRDRLVVALAFEAEENMSFEGELEDVLYDHVVPKVENMSLLKTTAMKRVLLPPSPIAEAASFGHVYYLPDRDGKLRWEALFVSYGDGDFAEYFPSLPLQAARIYLGEPLENLSINGGGTVDLASRAIPIDAHGRMHVSYYGREGTFPYISATDILDGAVDKSVFAGKAVFVGTSAISTYDLKVTPFSANMPGVEKNASVAANIIQKRYLNKGPLILDLMFVLFAGLSVFLVGRRLRATLQIGIFLTVGLLLVGTIQWLFTYQGLRVNLVYPLATLLCQGIFIISYRFLIEEKRAGEIRRMFSSYVTERVVDEMIKDPGLATLGGVRREVTILFSDIRGFTTFSEKNSPEEVVTMLNEYLTAMTEVVFHWDGTLDKFIGDAVVAFWGAPVPQENHAERAMRCTLHMIGRLNELREKWSAEGKELLDIGVGLNTGEVIVGNIGAEGKKMDYTVIGDNVNLASRVESLTKKYSARILTTEYTLEKILPAIEAGEFGHVYFEGLEKVIVKGKDESVEIFRISTGDHGGETAVTRAQGEVVRLTEK